MVTRAIFQACKRHRFMAGRLLDAVQRRLAYMADSYPMLVPFSYKTIQLGQVSRDVPFSITTFPYPGTGVVIHLTKAQMEQWWFTNAAFTLNEVEVVDKMQSIPFLAL